MEASPARTRAKSRRCRGDPMKKWMRWLLAQGCRSTCFTVSLCAACEMK